MEAVQPLQHLLQSLTERISALEDKIGTGGQPSQSPATENLSILAYDELVSQYLPPFIKSCDTLGDDIKTLGGITQKAFQVQRDFIVMASEYRKPSQLTPDLLSGIQACLKDMGTFRNNAKENPNHVKMVNEGIQALGWICEEFAPKAFVESYIGGSDFWGNKIRTEYKAANPSQIEFVSTFKSLLLGLMEYVKNHHVNGLQWNVKGQDVSSYKASSSSKTTETVSAKVEKEPETKKSITAPSNVKPMSTPKTAFCEQRGEHWFIEHQRDNVTTISDTHLGQKVYIFGCIDATIVMEGKVNTITLDSCKNTKLLFDDVVSSFEIINGKNIQAQCKGIVPSVAIDKTDGCMVYVSWEGRDVNFITSKSSEMNVSLPSGPGSDEMIERPLPEQFIHRISKELSISSEVSDLYSS
uniref:Adenylyl cyclaseassociated protein putative n=1 Tax=Albugo laibachii Nc14 TaxID=890382 RepID=F0WQ25_9STRA|nr:adenylyl cyclaseassociated protein putative [Albugo laibachii Nc14]|eukprot:CCA23430.1 adenylyl cyclaseassociated protein putative [Albugo laibachii Nc14]